MLLLGDFKHGWAEYEWRFSSGKVESFDFPQPQWKGQNISGKTILLYAEQGLGDTIQFVRYASMVKNQGAYVIVACQKPVAKLLTNISGIDQLITEGQPFPVFDCYAPLLSLPGIFKTELSSIPAKVPYLFADQALAAYWQSRLRGVSGFRMGINWRGKVDSAEWIQRDIPLDLMASLAELPGVRLISLQKGPGQQDLTSAAGRLPIIDLGEFDTEQGAFMDTAAIMMNLDLIITSDTSIAHLAGALGVPVWVALPLVPDWRWLLDRSDSPWYPTMRLFRQEQIGDWTGVFENIKTALFKLLEGEAPALANR